ncbi:MAG: hypothetical protein SGI92_21075 [Bryobacteraceae bacterium]|nr:hypothetical protein [Bryobacteraceae bacterium]
MKLLTLSSLILGMTVASWGQNPFPNPVRPMPAPVNALPYGNILYPGGVPSFPSALGATVRGNPPYTGVRPGMGGGGGIGNPGRPRTVVVPYAVPVFYGGAYDPYYAQQQQQPNFTVVVPQQPAPSVIINQTFHNGELASAEVPERGGLRVYEAPRSPNAVAPAEQKPEPAKRTYARDDKATIYLIALKDATVKEAIGYWLEGTSTLAYVTPDATITRVTLDLVDREGSLQLNAQRNLEFELRTR